MTGRFSRKRLIFNNFQLVYFRGLVVNAGPVWTYLRQIG